MYRKNRQQFIQQLRLIRQQLQSKVKTQSTQDNQIDPIVSSRYNLPTLQHSIPQQNQMTPRYKAFHFKYDIPVANRKIIKNKPQSAQLKSYQTNQSQISSENISQKLREFGKLYYVKNKQKNHKSTYIAIQNDFIRLKSLPSNLKTRANTAEVQQVNFQPYFQKLSQNRQIRKDLHINQAFNHLHAHFKIFRKLDPYLCLCLLKIGYYHQILPARVFYTINSGRQSFYFLLSGLIILLNENIDLKKHIFPGQSFGEQMLFSSNPIRKLVQQARCVSKSYILEIKISDYIILSDQSKKLGYVKQFTKFQQFLRKSFTDKNITRNQYAMQRRIRMKP